MTDSPSGNYVQMGYCRYAVFRIISFVVALLCLAFAIVFAAAPLARAKINNSSLSPSAASKYSTGKYITLSTYHLFQYEDYKWEKNKPNGAKPYSKWSGRKGCVALIHAMQAFGVLSLIFAALSFIFVIVFFALLVVHNNQRKAANAKRDAVYEKAHKNEVSHSVMRHRIEESDNRSFAHMPRQVDDNTIYMEADEEQVRELNGELAQLRKDENSRRAADRAIGWVLLFCWFFLFIFSLIAVCLFASFKLTYVKKYMNTSGFKDYSLSDAGFSSSDDLSDHIISVPYMAGFILLIIVVILSFIMIIFLAVQAIEGFFCCPSYDDDGIKDMEMVRVDPPPSATNQREQAVRQESLLPPPLFNTGRNACSVNYDSYGMNTYTNSSGNMNGNTNSEQLGAAYGIPMALPGPPVAPGATPNQVAESYYRDLGLPAPAYSRNSNNVDYEKPAKKAA